MEPRISTDTITPPSTDATAASDGRVSNTDEPRNDVGRLQKAETFLRNGEIKDVPASAKREFLEKKVGLSRDEIDMAMERVAKKEGIDRFHDEREIEGRRHLDGRWYGMDREPDLRGGYHDNRDRISGRRSPHGTSMHSQPSQHYDQNGNMRSYSSGLPFDHPDDHLKPSFSFTSWAGGFSLGVFCLAAFRWLNGGDFILFPPPTAGDREIKIENHVDEAGTEESVENDRDKEDVTSFMVDSSESIGAEDEYELNDEVLTSVLNDTSNAKFHDPAGSQLSHDDLVLEIRSLTAAVHSYREEQERTNRAAAAKIGRGVTDDVMDILRDDKSKSNPCESVVFNDIETASSLLREVFDGLASIKQSLESTDEQKEMTAAKNENTNTEEDGDRCNPPENPQTQENIQILADIGSLADKLQEAIQCMDGTKASSNVGKKPMDSVIEEIGPNASGDMDQNTDKLTTHDDESDTQRTPSPSESEKSNTEQHNAPLSDIDECNREQSSLIEQKSCDASDNSAQDLEQALKILSSKNSQDEVKVGAQMLYLYCMNISKNPTVPRYRKIYTNNSTFQKKVGILQGADQLLCSVGFEKKTNFYEWTKTNASSMETQSALDLALVALDMMRKGNKNEITDSSPVAQSGSATPNATNSSIE